MDDYEIFRARFGAAVRRRRKDRGMTQAEIAKKVGVEQPTIHRIERGRQGWDSRTVFGISRALRCSLADLMSEVEQVVPQYLPPEASAFARIWMLLPSDMREDYRRRIEGLANAMHIPVPDEHRQPKARYTKNR